MNLKGEMYFHRCNDRTILRTKWVFRSKHDENGKNVRNKARLVATDYNQEEGID